MTDARETVLEKRRKPQTVRALHAKQVGEMLPWFTV